MSDLKVGDKVRVKYIDVGTKGRGNYSYDRRLAKLAGETFEIAEISEPNRIRIYTGGYAYSFDPDWLERVEGVLSEYVKNPPRPFEEVPKPTSILLEAENIVNGERGSDYGDAVESFNRVAEMATMLTGVKLTADVCCKVMMAVKLTRQSHKHKRDNLVDLAGYAEILNRINNDKNK